VRIIAGRLKRRRLKRPSWEGLRPTSDKLRETLFNILAWRIEGARVLDGYAGTGAVGLEALSRGAARVVFVERDRRALALIAANLQLCGIEEGYTIEHGDVGAVLRQLPPVERFDVIFLDPPYADRAGEALTGAGRHLSPEGLVVLEHATRDEPEVPATLARVRAVRSGDSTLTLFEPRGEHETAAGASSR
jgi:16S rRNA (guanine966-N2)-methyltransferase